MAKPDAKKWPGLKQAWDDYGHSISWDQLVDMKSDRGMYVVLAWKEGDQYFCADMERAGHDQPWEMNNDGSEPYTEDQWNGLTIPPDCNWFEVPDEDELRQVEHDRLMTVGKYQDAFLIYNEGFDDGFGTSDVVEKWYASASRAKLMKSIKLPKSK